MALLPQCGTTEDAINFFGAFYAPISKNVEIAENRNVFLKKFHCAVLHEFISLNITLPFKAATADIPTFRAFLEKVLDLAEEADASIDLVAEFVPDDTDVFAALYFVVENRKIKTQFVRF